MRKFAAIIAISITLFFPGQASAFFLNGNQLYAKMTSPKSSDTIIASAYIAGAFDGITLHMRELSASVPKEVSASQINDIVKFYLEKHPEIRHQIAAKLIQDALLEVFVPKK